jgi:hypothetical protein
VVTAVVSGDVGSTATSAAVLEVSPSSSFRFEAARVCACSSKALLLVDVPADVRPRRELAFNRAFNNEDALLLELLMFVALGYPYILLRFYSRFQNQNIFAF